MATPLGSIDRQYFVHRVAGNPANPTTLSVTIVNPLGAEVSYEYGTDAAVVRSATGQFYVDVTFNVRGVWRVFWYVNEAPTAASTVVLVVPVLVTITSLISSIPLPFVAVTATKGEAATLEKVSTDAAGELRLELEPGAWRFSAYRFGYIFTDTSVDVVDGSDPVVELNGRAVATRWLRCSDLEAVVDASTVDRLFAGASGARDMVKMENLLQQAESLAESRLLRNWTRVDIVTAAASDPSMRAQAAWLAAELASESRQEFIAADGKGRWWSQYERAMAYFESLSKSTIETRAAEDVGSGANSGGAMVPRVTPPAERFVFAPNRGRGAGGF